jgi:predicted DNA-binding protein (MmcQ/YjbR family)
MTVRELIDLCLELPQAYEDYPFDEFTPVLRHEASKKMFALVGEHNGRLSINLKCDPFEADFLRQTFADIIPGWHMNKQHWNTVILGGNVPIEELRRQIENSYDLIKPKARRRNNS